MNVPKLRFKEFTDEWLLLKENIKILSGNMYPLSAYNDTGVLLIQGLNIYPKKLNLDKPIYISNEFNAVKHLIIQKNDILIGLNRPIINNELKICKFMYDYAYLYQRAGVLSFNKEKINTDCLYQYLQSHQFIKNLSTELVGSDQPYIKSNLFNVIKIYFPKLEEQNKIAKFLTTVDKKITNLENTITSLENQKKGLLQQIFSQKLRFKDKNGNNYPNWEEKLFSDIFSFLSTNSYSRTEMNEYHGTVKNIHYGDVLIKFNHIIDLSKHQLPYLINYNSLPKEILKEQLNKQLIKNGDIVIADTAEDYTAGKVCEVINVNDNLIVSGLHTMLCRPKPNLFSLGFLGYFMNSYTYHHQLLKLITGTKVYSIIKKEIIKTKILIPCLEEQTKIANFLSAFDRKLENQKAQLEHWKQIKKGLLQQMFV